MPAEQACSTPGGRVPEANPAGPWILVVEDDPGIRSIVMRMLKRDGYGVGCAAGAEEALAIAASREAPIDLVLCDVVLPGLNGREIVTRLQHGTDRPRAIFMSGHTTHWLLANGTFQEQNPFLQKPFTASELVIKVREVLNAE
jgi:two-component system, cell cycle sensor histidine kinase and response regulator CckA